MTNTGTQNQRGTLLRRGIHLEAFSITYNSIEAVVAIFAGWSAGSIALLGFGLDSGIEISASIVVLLRLQAETRSQDPEAREAAERRAERFVGGTLLALSLYVLYESVSTLIRKEPPSESVVGIVLAALSLIVMPLLARAKLRVGRALGSGALIADAKETLVCTYLSFTLLLGLGLNVALGWWWADPVAALAMTPWIFKEGREAWRGDECCH